MADEKNKGARKPARVEPGEIYMVNPGGAIHLMTRADAAYRLKWFKGWRKATPGEVALLESKAGYQTAEHPLCARPTLEPETPALEPDGEAVAATAKRPDFPPLPARVR